MAGLSQPTQVVNHHHHHHFPHQQNLHRDISAVETSFELSSLPLYRSSHSFQNLSLTGARILKNNGLTVTKSTP
jgi:hypothetical protein